ncbi:MAG TPA: hypothetical protein VEY95_09995 [Azospirillaceae bacterium]|nr:hypothetical protein [Azospirillaceae bacterium]
MVRILPTFAGALLLVLPSAALPEQTAQRTAPRSAVADLPFPDPPQAADDPAATSVLSTLAIALGRRCGTAEAFVWRHPAGTPRQDAVVATAEDRLADQGRTLSRLPVEGGTGTMGGAAGGAAGNRPVDLRAVLAEGPPADLLLLWSATSETLTLAVCDLGSSGRPSSGVG